MKSYTKYLTLLIALSLVKGSVTAQKVDYSVVSVPEESGLSFTKITNDNDAVCLPIVKRNATSCSWFSNKIIDISKDGKSIAFVSARNNTTNIFIKDLATQGGSMQRTHRQAVVDFSYSPDGKYITFSEANGNTNQIFQTDAKNGYICRQITSGAKDYSPCYSYDMKQIYFTRQEATSVSIWSQNIADNFLSTYSYGMNPCPIANSNLIICSRTDANGKSSLWKIDSVTGVEECLVSDPIRSFTTPSVSPDGKWIVFVGSNGLAKSPTSYYYNTDIFICRMDGSELAQLTYHAADDLCPTWSNDGRDIYFVSQRGSSNAIANIWRIGFTY